MRSSVVLMLSLLLSSISFAQDANPFNGNWKVTLTLPNGRNFSDIDLVVDGTGGSWQSKVINKNNRCQGPFQRVRPIFTKGMEMNSVDSVW